MSLTVIILVAAGIGAAASGGCGGSSYSPPEDVDEGDGGPKPKPESDGDLSGAGFTSPDTGPDLSVSDDLATLPDREDAGSGGPPCLPPMLGATFDRMDGSGGFAQFTEYADRFDAEVMPLVASPAGAVIRWAMPAAVSQGACRGEAFLLQRGLNGNSIWPVAFRDGEAFLSEPIPAGTARAQGIVSVEGGMKCVTFDPPIPASDGSGENWDVGCFEDAGGAIADGVSIVGRAAAIFHQSGVIYVVSADADERGSTLTAIDSATLETADTASLPESVNPGSVVADRRVGDSEQIIIPFAGSFAPRNQGAGGGVGVVDLNGLGYEKIISDRRGVRSLAMAQDEGILFLIGAHEYPSRVYRADLSNPKPAMREWSRYPTTLVTDMAFCPGLGLVIPNGNRIVAIDPVTGERVWESETSEELPAVSSLSCNR